MSKNLVIVESPAKARTLGKILGRNYSLKASLGHVRDLPRSGLGVNIEKGFVPKYVNIIPNEVVDGTNGFRCTTIFEGNEYLILDWYGSPYTYLLAQRIDQTADGFAVIDNGVDGHPNKGGFNYVWIAWG